MTVIEKEDIVKYFVDGAKQLDKGKEGVLAGHVLKMMYDPDTNCLSGCVRASQKHQVVYTAMVCLKRKEVERSTCTCAIGEVGRCHHVAALLFEASERISCTSVGCVWNQPAHFGKGNKGVPIEQAIGKERGLAAIHATIDVDTVLRERLKAFPSNQLAGTAFRWIVEGENGILDDEEEQTVRYLSESVPDVERILMSPTYESAFCKSSYLMAELQVSNELVQQVAKATMGQSFNSLWFVARRHRLTASKFSRVLSNVKSRQSFKTLAKDISGRGQDLAGIHAIEWGRLHERTALKEFERKMKALDPKQDPKVEPTGFWLHPTGVLGATPDGLFLGNVVEVKCPYSLRTSTLKEGLRNKTDYIIYLDAHGLWQINKEHEIYDQIQGQMYITNREKCVLLVWTPKELAILSVGKDPAWEKNIGLMINWYYERYIPYILNLM